MSHVPVLCLIGLFIQACGDLCPLRSPTLENQSRLYCCQIPDFPLRAVSNISVVEWLLAHIASVYVIQTEGPTVMIPEFPLCQILFLLTFFPHRSFLCLAAVFYYKDGEQRIIRGIQLNGSLRLHSERGEDGVDIRSRGICSLYHLKRTRPDVQQCAVTNDYLDV